MIGLLIDTSTNVALVGIAKNGSSHRSLLLTHDNQLSGSLLPSIQTLLTEAGITPKALQYIAVGAGPGSYTGTRVGIAVAKTLSFALSVPLIGFCSPKAFLPNVFGKFAHVLPSKMQTFYIHKGVKNEEQISHESKGLVLPFTDLSQALNDMDCVITSERCSLEKELSPQQLQKLQWFEPKPNFDYLSSFIYDKYNQKKFEKEGNLDVIYFHSLKF